MISFPGYSTDVVAMKVFHSLLKDFRVSQGQDFAAGAEHALTASIKDFRQYDWPLVGFVDPQRFKMWMQLRNLFKRHIFTNDVYSADELETKTNDEFVASQAEFAKQREVKPRTFAVLQEARRIAKRILGDYTADEIASNVQIGRRATLGGPLHKAYFDSKLGDPASFTCPTAVKRWFYAYLETDPHLKRCVRRVFRISQKTGKPVDLSADSLNLVNVPKSWKTFRGITPLSLIGLFLSYGIGSVVTDRLAASGLNISRLQSIHRMLAKKYSTSRTHATVDLRQASNSIMSHHLNYVLPRKWYCLLRHTFIRQINVKSHEQPIHSVSVLPMGNGATFPIETLFFYCIIRAVGNLLKVKGTYSVYGDDLIYPSKLHAYVTRIFSDLGICVNEDKTFVTSFFRESCGGDYYRGVDVRPALLPENPTSCLKGKRYASYLYSIANALRTRWKDSEIPTTVNWLLTELATTAGVIFQVPKHFPATSGWQTTNPWVTGGKKHTIQGHFPWYQPWDLPKVSVNQGCIKLKFRYLGNATPEYRKVEFEEVYLWDSLRRASRRIVPKVQDDGTPSLPRRFLWHWWRAWLKSLPKQQVDIGTHSCYMGYVPLVAGDNSRLVPTEPSKRTVGLHVANEVVSLEFWIQDSNASA